jgi:hypothetical protein
MSDSSSSSTLSAALAEFDGSYSAFQTAFSKAPDEALAYLPPGDEYALGVLPIHLKHTLQSYGALLDQVLAADFGPLDLTKDPTRTAQAAERHAFLVGWRPSGGSERAEILSGLDAEHARDYRRFSALDETAYARSAPVVYSADTEPYPTSPADILGWLTDHYREHTVQVESMLSTWKVELS